MKGRKPKPTYMKVLEGNRGKRPLNENVPKPKQKKRTPRAPSHLSKYAKEEWKRIAGELHDLNLLTKVDESALGAYCEAYSRWRQAEEMLQKSNILTKTTNGNVIQSPLVSIANRAMELMHKYMVEFGLTPSSRERLEVGKEDKEMGPAARTLNGNWS